MDSFIGSVFDARSRELFSEVSSLRQALGHRPLHGMTPSYQEFRNKLAQRVDALSQKYPDVDFGLIL